MPGRGVLSAVMDEALELVAPTRCVGCDEPGALLCDECLAALPWVRQELACPNCGAPHGGLTCTECSEPWETRACVCAPVSFGWCLRTASAICAPTVIVGSSAVIGS